MNTNRWIYVTILLAFFAGYLLGVKNWNSVPNAVAADTATIAQPPVALQYSGAVNSNLYVVRGNKVFIFAIKANQVNSMMKDFYLVGQTTLPDK